MNRTPEILAKLRDEIQQAPVAELPGIIGMVAALHAEAFARLALRPAEPSVTADPDDRLLTADEVAARLGGDTTSRWVRDHQDKLPRVKLPGRKLRFSANRLEAMIKRRSYG